MSNNLEVMRSYHQGYSTEILWIQAYRFLCLMVEALLFAGAFGLLQIHVSGRVSSFWMIFLLVLVFVLGLGIVGFWIRLGRLRSKRAREWQELISGLKTQTSAEANFQKLSVPGPAVIGGRFIFNWVVPIFLVLLWVGVFILGLTIVN